ncbi:MAG: hypothetical protein Q9P14_16485 [candidate division KSB1 bacterium]|nr:hypothetical protein [candidate division KSB1 bacterium]
MQKIAKTDAFLVPDSEWIKEGTPMREKYAKARIGMQEGMQLRDGIDRLSLCLCLGNKKQSPAPGRRALWLFCLSKIGQRLKKLS